MAVLLTKFNFIQAYFHCKFLCSANKLEINYAFINQYLQMQAL